MQSSSDQNFQCFGELPDTFSQKKISPFSRKVLLQETSILFHIIIQ